MQLYNEQNSYHYAFPVSFMYNWSNYHDAELPVERTGVGQNLRSMQNYINAFAFRVRSLLHKSFIFNFPN